MREKSRLHEIRIYGVNLEFVVTDSIDRSRQNQRRLRELGDCPPMKNATGLCSHNGMNFCILIDIRLAGPHVIAHEVFHAVHGIMDRVGISLDEDHHEAHAHLCGYITELIYDDLKRWGFKVKA